MNRLTWPPRFFSFLLFVIAAGLAAAGETVLFDAAAPGALDKIKLNGVTASIVSNGKTNVLQITCAPGNNDYPGIEIPAPEGGWNLSENGRICADIANNGNTPVTVTLRVDNPGDWKTNPWNGESSHIKDGKSGTPAVTFGYSWGKPGFKLDSSKIIRVMLFTGKPQKELKYQIEKIYAAGAKGDKPAGITSKVRPENGIVFTPAAALNGERLRPADGAAAAMEPGKGMAVKFTASGQKTPAISVLPPKGEIWDFGLCTEVNFTVKNTGNAPVALICRLNNNNSNGIINCANGGQTIDPGKEATVTVPFVTDKVWDGNKKNSGMHFGSDAVRSFSLIAPAGEILLTKVQGRRGTCTLPEWAGKRPPTAGDWTLTFSDDFTAPALDRKKWSLPLDDVEDKEYADHCDRSLESIWDKMSVNTAANALVGNGHLTMRVTKMKNPSAEIAAIADKVFAAYPARKDKEEMIAKLQKRRYLSTVVTSFGLFAQKYGYFEARMKIAEGLGMWPAFWLMPDRGAEAGIWWKRTSTHNGGMEFDIFEYLGRYGGNRYNLAMHWDGYGKEHKSVGTENAYFAPDKDGYLTAGLLWEPGKASFYAQGRLVAVWENPRVANVPMYLMFTQPLGGWGTNGIVEDAKLPFDLQIDYVRVWQRADLAGK